VKGEQAQTLEMRFTPQGPVVFEDRERGKIYSVRSIWAEPGSCPYARSLSTMRATSVADYETRLAGWAAPSGNHVCADVEGHVGWIATGLSPRRRTHDGLTPVPGDGRYEWAGFYDYADLPRRFDPPEGYVASANEMNLPPAFLATGEPFGFEWPDRSRITRIREILGAGGVAGVEETMALQTDTTSQHARRLATLALVLPRTEGVASALDLLNGFSGRLAPQSAAAALVEVWLSRRLKPATLAALCTDAETRALLGPGDTEAIVRALESPDARFGAEPAAARDALLARTLGEAWGDCVALMGDDAQRWMWGDLHHGYFAHPLASVPEIGAKFDAGPWPLGGSGASPMHTGYRASDFRAMLGASFRLAVDLADPDRSRFVNGSGQSGDPRSPHYADHGASWAAGAYFPLPFTAQAVDKAVRTRLRLEPKG
jgi:penicillin amidase